MEWRFHGRRGGEIVKLSIQVCPYTPLAWERLGRGMRWEKPSPLTWSRGVRGWVGSASVLINGRPGGAACVAAIAPRAKKGRVVPGYLAGTRCQHAGASAWVEPRRAARFSRSDRDVSRPSIRGCGDGQWTIFWWCGTGLGLPVAGVCVPRQPGGFVAHPLPRHRNWGHANRGAARLRTLAVSRGALQVTRSPCGVEVRRHALARRLSLSGSRCRES